MLHGGMQAKAVAAHFGVAPAMTVIFL